MNEIIQPGLAPGGHSLGPFPAGLPWGSCLGPFLGAPLSASHCPSSGAPAWHPPGPSLGVAWEQKLVPDPRALLGLLPWTPQGPPGAPPWALLGLLPRNPPRALPWALLWLLHRTPPPGPPLGPSLGSCLGPPQGLTPLLPEKYILRGNAFQEQHPNSFRGSEMFSRKCILRLKCVFPELLPGPHALLLLTPSGPAGLSRGECWSARP